MGSIQINIKEKKERETWVWSLDQQDPLEKEMASHSSILAWRITWTEELGRLQSMGLQTVRHDWVTSLSLFTFMHWRRKWQPTPVILPGESQGQGSLVGCRLWGCTESDTTEVTQQQQQHSAMYVVLTCIYLLISDIEHFFMYLLAVCISSLEKCLFKPFSYF